MQQIESSAKWVAIVAILLFCLIMGFCTYSEYEPIHNPRNETIQAMIIGHSGGRSGKNIADPYFRVKLPNGIQITVKDWGELPVTYIGPVVLNKGKGEATNVTKYTINRAKTLQLHNK
jgi:hypothetical protein